MDPKKDKWKRQDKLNWLAKQRFQRSYQDQVRSRIDRIKTSVTGVEVSLYGNLTLQDYAELKTADTVMSAQEYKERYPLFYAKVGDLKDGKPNVIVTGGTHGYEESGVYGALEFLEQGVSRYAKDFNFLVFPCVSPFSFEINQRWTHDAWDPNRSFDRSKPYVPEAQLVMDVLDEARNVASKDFIGAVDLHETPERDKILMPPQYERFGIPLKAEDILIPNGYYLIADASNRKPLLARQMVERVRELTAIAPDPEIHGDTNDRGVVVCAHDEPTLQGLNMSYMRTISDNAFTTEIFPEIHPEPKGPLEAIAAQRATIEGMLDSLVQ